jgi:hypothetical protein
MLIKILTRIIWAIITVYLFIQVGLLSGCAYLITVWFFDWLWHFLTTCFCVKICGDEDLYLDYIKNLKPTPLHIGIIFFIDPIGALVIPFVNLKLVGLIV